METKEILARFNPENISFLVMKYPSCSRIKQWKNDKEFYIRIATACLKKFYTKSTMNIFKNKCQSCIDKMNEIEEPLENKRIFIELVSLTESLFRETNDIFVASFSNEKECQAGIIKALMHISQCLKITIKLYTVEKANKDDKKAGEKINEMEFITTGQNLDIVSVAFLKMNEDEIYLLNEIEGFIVKSPDNNSDEFNAKLNIFEQKLRFAESPKISDSTEVSTENSAEEIKNADSSKYKRSSKRTKQSEVNIIPPPDVKGSLPSMEQASKEKMETNTVEYEEKSKDNSAKPNTGLMDVNSKNILPNNPVGETKDLPSKIENSNQADIESKSKESNKENKLSSHKENAQSDTQNLPLATNNNSLDNINLSKPDNQNKITNVGFISAKSETATDSSRSTCCKCKRIIRFGINVRTKCGHYYHNTCLISLNEKCIICNKP